MGFIDEETRDRIAPILQREKAEEDAFCDTANLEKIVGSIRRNAQNRYISRNGTPVSEAETVDVDYNALNITPTVLNSERCIKAVYEAIREYEPSISVVDIKPPLNRPTPPHRKGRIVVSFDPPLS